MKIRLACAFRHITAIILATIMIFQIFTFSQFGITGRNNNSDNINDSIIQSALAQSAGSIRVGTYYDPNTCELTANVKYEAYKTGFTKGKSVKEWIPPDPTELYSTITEQSHFIMGYQDGFDCINGQKQKKGQDGGQPQQQVDQKCPDIIKMQDTGETTTAPKGSVCPPIIFIPGIGGSELEEEILIRPDLWPLAPFRTRAHLMLEPNGGPMQGIKIIAKDVIRNIVSSYVYPVYQPLITFLEGEGYKEGTNLTMFPYDWRVDNNLHIIELDKKVNDVLKQTNSKKVILLTHSMGGLIARAYINTIGSQKVDAQISLAMPLYGSPVPFYALTNGYVFGNPSVRQELMKILEQNWPAGYQLSPQKPFIQESGTGKVLTVEESYGIKYKGFVNVDEDIISRDDYTPTQDNVWSANRILRDNANAFHSSLVDKNTGEPKPLPPGVKHFAIIGTGVKTLNSSVMRDATAEEIDKRSYVELLGRKVVLEPRFDDGDGTVPLWSSKFDGVTAKYYVPYIATATSEHSALTANPNTHVIIKRSHLLTIQ
jgi:pimeloyl-ACP methyl ester carboxylesterase